MILIKKVKSPSKNNPTNKELIVILIIINIIILVIFSASLFIIFDSSVIKNIILKFEKKNEYFYK